MRTWSTSHDDGGTVGADGTIEVASTIAQANATERRRMPGVTSARLVIAARQRVLFHAIAQRLDGDVEQLGRAAAIAARRLEGLGDQRPLEVRQADAALGEVYFHATTRHLDRRAAARGGGKAEVVAVHIPALGP